MNQHPSLPALRRLLPWLGLLAAALLACGPFLSGGVWHGSDLGYHLRRIENIAMGLADRQFPVRIQSDWLLGNGYAVGVFYGDLLLYAPALLRLAGVPVTVAYDLYLFAVTLLTAWGGYYAARRLALPRAAAFGAAALYTLAAYRLCDVTDRAALGEYTALAFLPLAAAGFWRTLHPDAARLPGAALLVLGLSGVLQSHLLSFEMTVLCLCAAALVLARATFRRAALLRLTGAAGAFCLLNAGFLVPLLDYYLTGKFQINQPGGVEPIQQNGAALGQLLGVGYTLAAGQQQDLVADMALTPGPALLLGAALAAGAAVWQLVRRRAGMPAAACLGAVAAGGVLPGAVQQPLPLGRSVRPRRHRPSVGGQPAVPLAVPGAGLPAAGRGGGRRSGAAAGAGPGGADGGALPAGGGERRGAAAAVHRHGGPRKLLPRHRGTLLAHELRPLPARRKRPHRHRRPAHRPRSGRMASS